MEKKNFECELLDVVETGRNCKLKKKKMWIALLKSFFTNLKMDIIFLWVAK